MYGAENRGAPDRVAMDGPDLLGQGGALGQPGTAQVLRRASTAGRPHMGQLPQVLTQ